MFASTINLFQRLYQDQGFQVPKGVDLEERVYRTFLRMYEAFDRDRPLVPVGQFSEVRYEDLTAAPLDQLRRIYGELELGGFDDARPAIEQFLQGQAGYKKNKFVIAPETRAEIARRWGAFCDKYGYAREAAE
jgi:hypothetical protein